MARRLFTSESVTEGHPDKIADQISDGVVDALLAQDPLSRVAVETLITTGQVHVAGEVTTKAYADINTIVRETIIRIGYDSSKKGFDGNSCGVNIAIKKPFAPITLLERIVWCSKEGRRFLFCDDYVGPDRRFQDLGAPKGREGRRREDLERAAQAAAAVASVGA